MKSKKDVYVVVDTPKKAEKLKKVLDMFGERLCSPKYTLVDYKYISLDTRDETWTGSNDLNKPWVINKTEVSIKELKQILAKEHLKPNDVVICKIGDTEYIVEFDRFRSDLFYSKRYITIHKDGSLGSVRENGAFYSFIRYATPEEIALLEPKPKELEVGKWYKVGKMNSLMVWNNGNPTYGFFKGSYDIDWSFGYDSIESAVEATPQEVESTLIEEAKRRGYKTGLNIKSFVSGITPIEYSEIQYRFDSNILVMGGAWIFKNGKWATIIEQDKFAELKEAHKNAVVIQFRNEITNYEWDDCWSNIPSWDIDNEYRIKPEEEPKVGDVVKVDYGDDFAIKILRPSELSSPLYKYTKLNKQQLLDLFPNIE